MGHRSLRPRPWPLLNVFGENLTEGYDEVAALKKNVRLPVIISQPSIKWSFRSIDRSRTPNRLLQLFNFSEALLTVTAFEVYS